MSEQVKKDQEVAQLREDANRLLYMSEEVAQIATPEQEERATEFLAQAKRRFKIVDERRKKYVKPLKEHIDMINADFKTILEPLEKCESIVKKGMAAYRNSVEFKAKEAERIEAERRMAQAARDVRNEGLTNETLENAREAGKALQEASVEAPKTVAVQSGAARFRKEWKFEIVDRDKLPVRVREDVLKLAFEKGLYDQVIRGMVKAGHREIEGVNIWEENVPVIRT